MLHKSNATLWPSSSFADLGRDQEAIRSYERAIRIKPDYADTWNNEGRSLVGVGRYQEAITSFERAIRIKPDYADAWYNKGIILRNLGKQKDADRCFAKARELGLKS
jgi:tetratricopeptide (TPR) repeat protein